MGPKENELTHEVHLGTVTPKILIVSAGRVTFIFSSIAGLKICDVEQCCIALDAFHIDLASSNPLCVDGIREGRVHGADDLDFSLWGRGQVDGPLEILLGRALEATHIAPDGDVGPLCAVQRSLLYSHLPLS